MSREEKAPAVEAAEAKSNDHSSDDQVDRHQHNSTNGGGKQAESAAERLLNDSITFLQQLRSGGPWILTAIVPDGPTTTVTARTVAEVVSFVNEHNGQRNLYYSVNPTRTAVSKKTSKTDIAAIEYLLADLDPRDDETAEAGKARYLQQLETFDPKPTAIIDSGNGIQDLWKLTEPIVLGAPLKTANGKLAFSPEDQAKIKDAEDRTKAIMLRLGAKPGTRNIDRILRLPGTTNLPNAKKLREGRVPCPTRLMGFNSVSYGVEFFPLPAEQEQRQEQTTPQDGGHHARQDEESGESALAAWVNLNLAVIPSGG